MNTVIIGKSCAPSIIKKNSSQDIQEFLVSYGGGMGGASVFYYGTEKAATREGFITVECYDGKEVEINPRFLVSVKDKKLVTVISDVTDHRNFHKTVCNSAIETRYILLETDAKYKISHDIQTEVKNKDMNVIDKVVVTS